MGIFTKLIAVTALLIVVQELFRRAGKWTAWGFFLVLPIALVPVWAWRGQAGVYEGVGVFPWVKLFSLQLAVCWLTALRFTSLGNSSWARGLLFLMLPFNMLEAMTQDAFGGHLAHLLLVITGVLLIFSVPNPMRAICIDTTDRFRELRYVGMTRTWIAGYTLWNEAFVYLNYPAIAGHQLAVLTSAFLIGMVMPNRWLQARGFTLAVDLLVLATFPAAYIRFTDTSYWASPHRENITAGICLAIATIYASSYFLLRHKRRAASC